MYDHEALMRVYADASSLLFAIDKGFFGLDKSHLSLMAGDTESGFLRDLRHSVSRVNPATPLPRELAEIDETA